MRHVGALLSGIVMLALASTAPRLAHAQGEHAPAHQAPVHKEETTAHEKVGEVGAVGSAEHAVEEELGEGHHGAELDGKKLALQLVNFLALVGLLFFFGRKAVTQALTTRHQQLKAELATAAEQRTAAQARLAEQEKRLASLEHEIAEMRAGIHREAEVEKAKLIEVAEERARRIQEETKFLLDQQVKEAESELRREAARAAVDLAEQMVKRALNAGDQQRLLDTFVTDVAAPPTRRNV